MKKILFLCAILGALGAVEVNVNLGSVNIGTDELCDKECRDEFFRRSPPPPKAHKNYKKWQKAYEKWQKEYYKKYKKKK